MAVLNPIGDMLCLSLGLPMLTVSHARMFWVILRKMPVPLHPDLLGFCCMTFAQYSCRVSG